MVKRNIATWVAASGLILGLSACTNPYDPAQRAIGGVCLAPVPGRRSGCRRWRTWGGTWRCDRWRRGCPRRRHYHTGTGIRLRLLSGTSQLLWLLRY